MYRKIFLAVAFQLSNTTVFAAGFTLNDTGNSYCFIKGRETQDCIGTGADAEFGRDVTHPSNLNGYLGFTFTKLDAAGNEISKASTQWACIKDNVTGLIWENKTSDGTIHDGGRRFDQLEMKPELLANASNAEQLCGYADWRIPTRRELLSIISFAHRGSTLVDERYFPNTGTSQYWTSTVYRRRASSSNYWTINFFSMDFDGRRQDPREPQFARAVRSDKSYGVNHFLGQGDEVEDRATGLTWKRCSVGQTWDGATCVGPPVDMTVEQAAAAARDESARTGESWRVPNFKELDSIIDTERRWAPSIDIDFFPGYYGYSITWTSDYSTAFSFTDGDGGTNLSRDSVANVRLVRDISP
jgi:hypothetical protein